jgi:LuxR family transcriptional regulator, maltose regulon positive regulatory protein
MASDTSIIRTRITAPRRRKELVARKRLNDLLGSLVEKRLVLISAPAGYGKTSLLVDFINTCELPVCWYTIDRLDFDPQRFVTYFVAAIRQRFPAFGQRTMAALSDSQNKLDVDHIATVVINDLYDHVSEHFLLILDDFHLVNDSLQVRGFISRFLQDMEENCHIVITSRTLLSLSVLPLMAARSEVSGVSYEELAFLPEEIQRLYQQNSHQILSIEAAEEIQRQTEGWITGIILASQVNKENTAARVRLARVSGFGLDDYFLQVIDTLSEDLRTFLVRSSLLEEFNVDRCAQVLGRALSLENAPWQEWMDAVQKNNLFVLPVGDEGDWLRYHPLFLDFLQSLAFTENAGETRAIEHSLAKVCIENNEWDRAFSIYHRLESTDELIELIETAGPDMLTTGRISTLSAWLDVLPVEILNSKPFIVALQGYVAMALGDTTLALTLYDQAISAMSLPDDRVYMARTLAMRATLHWLAGRLDAAIADSNETMLLVNNDLEMRKTKGDVLRCIGLCHWHQGKLKEALDWLGNALQVMQSIHDQKNEAIIYLELGAVYENLGKYSLCKEAYNQALDYWRQEENPIWLSTLYNNLGVLYQMLGDYEEASRSFEHALEFARLCGYARMEAFILTGIGDVYTELQAYEQADQAYRMAIEIADRIQEHFLQVYINVQSAAVAGLRGNLDFGFKLINTTRLLVTQDGTEFDREICELEFAGLRILENHSLDAIPSLEKACSYFEQAGQIVQCQKAHLYLAIAYQATSQPEKLIEHLLQMLSYQDGESYPASLVAMAARFRSFLEASQVEYLHEELDRFLEQVIGFQERLPSLRRYLREHAKAVPFAPPTLYIRALGKMQVKVDNHLVTNTEWQTQAARDLFFMLLAHPEGMTKEEISLNFWPDASTDEVKFRFKNTIYRLRRAIGKNSILLEQDIYRFNNKLDYEYDVELFLKENVLAAQAHDPVQKLSHFREAIKYYQGNYLPEILDTWVDNNRECLRQNNLNTLLQVSEIYLNQSNYELAQEYCQRVLNEDNLLEEAYRLALRIYAATGNRAGLVRQYKRCVEIFEREINSPPSQQTQALYQDLLK